MNAFLETISGVIILLAAVPTLYLSLLGVAALFFRGPGGKGVPDTASDQSAQSPWPSIVVLIPAHNEENDIAATVAGVQEADYPPDKLRITVLADNCTDNTAKAARAAGADVVERSDPDNRGKGQALDWFFKTRTDILQANGIVTIIDADTRMDPAFPKEIARSMASGARAVQGYYGVSNPGASRRTALMEAALAVFHHLRPAGRNRLGGSAGLKGNGMAFSTDLMARTGWPAHSLVEDLEFGAMLLETGICVHYNPHAVVLAEMTPRAAEAAPQRQRWEAGRLGVARQWVPRLARAFVRAPSPALADGILDLVTPPLTLLVCLQVVGLVFSLFAAPALLPVTIALPVLTGLLVALGLWLRRSPAAVWKALLFAPFFIIWKILLYFSFIRRRPSGWTRTRRVSEQTDKPGDRP